MQTIESRWRDADDDFDAYERLVTPDSAPKRQFAGLISRGHRYFDMELTRAVRPARRRLRGDGIIPASDDRGVSGNGRTDRPQPPPETLRPARRNAIFRQPGFRLRAIKPRHRVAGASLREHRNFMRFRFRPGAFQWALTFGVSR